MQGTIIERPQSDFLGIRVVGTFETLPDLIPDARSELLKRQYEIEGILNPNTQLGITLPNAVEANEDDVTTYLGFEVERRRKTPTGMSQLTLPSGKYAQFEWHGSFLEATFESFYPQMFGSLAANRLAPSPTKPWIEVYGADYDWDDKSSSSNRLTVLIPLVEGDAGA